MMTSPMDATLSVDAIARRIVADGVAPDCAAACAVRRRSWRRESGGSTELLFDLASITKPMTAVAVARAGLDLRTPLGELVAEAVGTPSEHIPLELFLAHRAGLEGHRPLYAPLVMGDVFDVAAALREAAGARRPDAAGELPPEGFAPVYSDLGYVLAGVALARATGLRDAGEAISRWVLRPLGIERQAGTVRDLAEVGVFGPFVTTETVPWRGGPILGMVHDENAWALTGKGGSGHAGVFATADALLTFGCAALDASIQAPWMTRERPGGTLLAGFDAKSPGQGVSSGGERMGPKSFCHLGFTGTSLWIDPEAEVVALLLTNRVCPTRASTSIREARPMAHDALFERAIFLAHD